MALKGGLKAWFEEQLREQREELRAEFEAQFASKDELAALRAELEGKTGRATPSGKGDPEADGSRKGASPGQVAANVSLSESVWDLSMFIGHSVLGCGGSLLVLAMLFVNVTIQGIFVLLIKKNLVEEPFSDEEQEGLRAWRNVIGHDMRFVSDSSQVSLVERVCKQDPTLELATEQMNKVQMINGYMNGQDQGAEAFLQGPTMCIIALCVWTMCTMKELGAVFDLARAMCRVPGGGCVKTLLCEGDDGSWELRRLGVARRMWMALILFARVGVAGTLLVIGLLYLVYTNSIADLILNAMALELVLNVDELIFSAMAPVKGIELIRNLVPLKFRPWTCCGMDIKSISGPIFLAGCVATSAIFVLRPAMNRIDRAWSILCAGNTSFGIEYDGLDIVRVRGLRSYDPNNLMSADHPVAITVSDVNTSWTPETWGYALVSGSDKQWMDQADVSQMIDTISDIHVGNVQCTDSLTSTAAQPNRKQVFQKYLSRALGIPEPETCADLRQHCLYKENQTHLGLAFVRAVCPVTCGCNSLSSGTILAPPEMGCPTSCLVETTSGPPLPNGALASVPCVDVIPGDFQDVRAISAVTSMMELDIVWQSTFAWDLIDEFTKWGCGLVRMLRQQNIDLCYPDSNLILGRIFSGNPYTGQLIKLFTFYCPKECNCDGRHISYPRQPPARLCPPSCSCPWNMPGENGTELDDSDFEEACQFGTVVRQMDKRCCYLMNLFLDGRDEKGLRYETVLAHLCHPCRFETCFLPNWGPQSYADCNGRQIRKLSEQ